MRALLLPRVWDKDGKIATDDKDRQSKSAAIIKKAVMILVP